MSEYKLEIAKGVIVENYEDADCGIFNTRNLSGDSMTTIYDNEELGLTIDICYGYSYYEVFGLTEKEFRELERYYNFLRGSEENEA